MAGLCLALWYYKHFNAKTTNRQTRNQQISRIILKIYADCDKQLGAYKITHILQRDYGINISVGRVYRLLKKLQLPKMSTDKPHHHIKPTDSGSCTNHLHQNFNQKAPNLVWTSDFTYIKVNGKWYYLCIIMDLFSRKVVSWHISDKADTNLIIAAFKKAYNKRNSPYGLMFHSDQGTQYTSKAFRELLDSLNIVQSFSKKGYPYDNACCECFFKYLKKEETNRRTYHSLMKLKQSIFAYIEGFYNSKRPHSSLGMMTPNEKVDLYLK